MDWQFGLSIGILVYMAFVFDFFGFLARDELLLRLLMLAASVLYLFYYYHVADTPLWDAITTNAVLGAANLAMIGVVILERTTFSMSKETEALFQQFPMLTPGQFRRLLKSARTIAVTAPRTLTMAGTPVKRLWYVHEGALRIDKTGQETLVEAPMFVGELAFLTGAQASASVTAEPGARILEWDAAELHRLLRKSSKLHVALQAQFNADLVRKVTHSAPLAN
ncbi:Crp/Fnr family transcriptional regulator [Roseovarius sp.]|uniref:Crp/Fnr family transcriptional regulator n=1 Tax=Roseovarius sp. TaxID=1486281 RepID=UPI003A97A332